YSGRVRTDPCGFRYEAAPSCPPPSATGQRLKNVDLVFGPHWIRQPCAISDRVAVDIDRDMPTQSPLIIQHITAKPRMRSEHLRERLAYCDPCHLRRGRRQESLQRRGEQNRRH